VIEVIGHTDEQRIVERPSNLDKTLIPFLQNKPGNERFVPADNAGLGLARAVAVTRVLSTDGRLADFQILPFSAAQLIDTGDKVATGLNPGDVKERRRIEIRVRRSDKEKGSGDQSWRAASIAVQLDQPLIGMATVVDGDTIEIANVRIRRRVNSYPRKRTGTAPKPSLSEAQIAHGLLFRLARLRLIPGLRKLTDLFAQDRHLLTI
jgi:hypothetical protein